MAKKKEIYKDLIERLVERDILPTLALSEIPSDTDLGVLELKKLEIEAMREKELAEIEKKKALAQIAANKEIEIKKFKGLHK